MKYTFLIRCSLTSSLGCTNQYFQNMKNRPLQNFLTFQKTKKFGYWIKTLGDMLNQSFGHKDPQTKGWSINRGKYQKRSSKTSCTMLFSLSSLRNKDVMHTHCFKTMDGSYDKLWCYLHGLGWRDGEVDWNVKPSY